MSPLLSRNLRRSPAAPHLLSVILALALGLLSAALPAGAQVSTFDLSGVIKDEQGGVLPGVTVTMRNEATGVSRTVVTDPNGRYYFANLPPQGTWELTAELAGFATHKQAGLEFYANTKPVINLTMKIAQVQETVTVSTEAPLLDTGQATLGLSVNKEQISELPLNGRDYLDLALLGSGVSDVGTDNVLGSRSQTISGAYSRYTAYTLDGFNNTRDQHGVEKTDIALDAVSEFRVQTNQFSAEYGETVGGIVTLITKSGTNSVQGTGALFVRPGSWDSPNKLTGVKAPFSRQDVTAAIGGPLVKDRTQYFANIEYRNEDQQAEVTAPIDNGRFKGTFPLGTNRTRVFGKVNHSFNENNLFEAKFVLGDETSTDSVGGLSIVDNMRTNVNDDITFHGTYTRLFSNNRLNEFRFGVSNEDYSSSAEKPKFTPTGVALIYPGQGNLGSTNRRQTAPDQSVQVANTFTWHTTGHSVKIGGSARSATPGGVLLVSLDGAYRFAPGAPYPYDPNVRASWPIQFEQGFFGTSSTELKLKKWHYAAFVQDDWKLSDTLTLNLGVRYQYETLVPDKNNLAPRVGFAWDVTGNAKTVVRGGAGIFYGTVFSTINAFEGFNSPLGFRVVTFAPGDPNFPQYPNNLPGPQIPAGVVPPPGNFYLDAAQYAPSKRQSPESYNFTIGFERQLMATLSAAVDLSYNRGVKLLVPTDVNAPTYFDYSTGLTRSPQAGDAARPFGVPGRSIPAGVVSDLPSGYPLGGYRDLYLLESSGDSRYTALRISLNKRLSYKFSLQGHYTWSRATNNGDGFRPGNALPLNPKDRNAEWARSATDVPHSFSLNGVYQLPYDFQLAAIARARPGQPVDPRVGVDLNGDRNTRERPFANGKILERNSFRAPGYAVLDLGIGKAVRLGRRRIEGRLETFNVTNRLNPAGLNSTYGPDANNPRADFMRINSVNPPRQYQLSVRVVF